ncbi:hypothetical protein GGR25_000127 [Kaistia hirudinis]|uniref:Yip1 domain-containing protein n=1 Tax=Kaistia hirudinis TaxID=1293440 RepID=A0A840AI42_9HYPH|nr:hypothetical protein [Kaistia hirudinis]MBB3929108.1 hypothetical protein [Kaistia hirudinis]
MSIRRVVISGLRGFLSPRRAVTTSTLSRNDLGILFAFSVALVAVAAVISRWSVARIGPVYSFESSGEPLATIVYFIIYGLAYAVFVFVMASFLLAFLKIVKINPNIYEYIASLSFSSLIFAILTSLSVLGIFVLSRIDEGFVDGYKNFAMNISGVAPLGFLTNSIIDLSFSKFYIVGFLVIGSLAATAFTMYWANKVIELIISGARLLIGGA